MFHLGDAMPLHDADAKSVTAALRESEERYRALFDSIDEGFCIIEVLFDQRNRPIDYRFLEMNPAFVAQTGLVEARGRTVRELVPDHEEHWFEIYGRVAVTGEPARFENEARHLDPPRWYDVYAFRCGAPDKRQVAVLFKDIGPRKQAEDALRASREALARFTAELEHQVASRTRELSESREALKAERQRFLDMLDTLPVIIDIIRADHRIEWANRAYREALGDNTGKICYASQFGRDEPCVECQAFIPLETGRPHRWEWTLPNGRTFDIHNFPFAARDGSAGILEMDIDVTEQRRAEIMLRDLNATLERRVAERTAALQQSEEQFRGIVETAEEGIATHDADGTVTYVNQRMADMLGCSREEIVGRPALDFLDDEEKEAVIRMRETLQTQGRFGTERRLRRKDGSALWTIVNISPRRNDAGTLLGYLAMHTDITERKRAEDALREATRRFQTIVDHAPIAIYAKDRDGRFVFGNRRLERYAGRPLEQLLGKTDYDFAPKADADRWRANDLEVLEGRVAEFEEVGTDRDGRPYVNLSVKFPVTDESGRTVEMCGISTDITDRKRADEALRDSAALLAEAERIARLGSWKWDIRTGSLTWSRETFRLLGHEPESLRPNYDRFLALVHPEDLPKVRRAIDDALAGRTHFDLDFRFLRSDGSVSWIHSAGEVAFAADGKPATMTGVVLDITERKRAEEALREADRRKDEFIAILSHELRNPLAPIRYALPLLSEEPLGEGGRRAVAVIDRQAAHLTRLVDDLLDVSRITAGKIDLRRDLVTLAAVVAAAVEAASPAIATGRHSLDIAIPDDPVWLNVDAGRISQAITNLLNNSAKYTPQAGRIRLEATSHDDVAVIRVIDNGVGIRAESLATVFEMFRQAGGPNRTQGGLGVGLTLTRQFVEMHGGTIEAHSAGENAGAEFVIRLPLASAALPRDERQEPRPTGGGARLRVLVVDDNVDLVDMLAMVIEAAGHDVRKAFDGRSAISAALECQPHVILLDVGMPGMNGIQVASELRRHPETARARIVALTGWGQTEDRRRTAQAGFDDHLTKPTDPRQIERILREVAERTTAPGG